MRNKLKREMLKSLKMYFVFQSKIPITLQREEMKKHLTDKKINKDDKKAHEKVLSIIGL